jgi:DNA-binding NtrC family response regulator
MYRLLVVDDEITMLRGIQFHYQDNSDYELLTASDKKQAVRLLEENEFDIIVSDLMLPRVEDGLEVIRSAKNQAYQPVILAMTAFETVENAVACMKNGADDFVSKGFGLDELSLRIENILKRKNKLLQLSIENQILKETIQQQYNNFEIIGKSQKMQDLLKKVRRLAADAKSTCIITGESGTGKDLIARSIHAISIRRDSPFVPINCAAIPENLIESELFGYEKGAFTGAYTNVKGKFELANGGVILLDEIGELPLPLQVRLLRVLEERSFYRIGGKYAIDIDIMVIAATNQDLADLIKKNRFREDLYFRLNVISLEIPPLRERREDIRPLALFFLQKFNRERKRDIKFSEASLELLESYDYRGNVRELRNIIEDAFVFCNSKEIVPENLLIPNTKHKQEKVKRRENKETALHTMTHREAMDILEKEYFQILLERHFWNYRKAARAANLTREWLMKKAKLLGIKKV